MINRKPGDTARFFGTQYTLIEPVGSFGWLVVETDNARATFRILLIGQFDDVPSENSA